MQLYAQNTYIPGDSQTLNPVNDRSCHKIIQTIQYSQNYTMPLWLATVCRITVQFLAKSLLAAHSDWLCGPT